MKKVLGFGGFICLAMLVGLGSWTLSAKAAVDERPFIITQKILADDGQSAAAFGEVVVFSRDSRFLFVGAPDQGAGQVYIYEQEDDAWELRQKLQAAGAADGDHFGAALAIAAGPTYTLVVGAPGVDGNAETDLGAAYTFTFDGSTWTEEGALPITEASPFSQDRRGAGVAINRAGTEVIVGAPGVQAGGISRGAAYVLTNSGNSWSQAQKISGPTSQAAGMGRTVYLRADDSQLLIAGLYSPSGGIIDQGLVYVFEKPAASWTEQDSLKPSDGVGNDEFGASIAAAAGQDRLLVGAPNHGSGQAYFYTENGGSWSETEILAAPGTFRDFGQGVDFDAAGDQAVIGAWLNNSGAIYRYEVSASTLTELQTLIGPDNRQEHLGYDVVLSNDGGLIAGGARSAHSNLETFDSVGAVYLYVPGNLAFLPIMIRP